MKYNTEKKQAYIRDLADRCQSSFDNASEFYTQIQQERETNLAYYMQLALGNESKGFSQFITSDVRDTVDWAMAQLLEIFTTGDSPVRFVPVNANDVDQADLETKYVNHVIKDQNKGFEIFYTWFKDALISKNGVVKCYWDEYSDQQPENYKNLGFEEYMQVVNDPEYMVKKVEIEIDGLNEEYTPEQFAAKLQEFGPNAPIALQAARFEIKGYRVKDLSQVRIENVAPEYFVVSTSQAELDLSNTDYCAHVHFYSRNELIEEGFDPDVVNELPIGSVITETIDSTIRYTKETGRILDNNATTPSGELVEVIEHYVRDAPDNSDDPKLWCIKTAANGSVILDAYEVDKVPYHVITPKINPYRFFGDALADELVDLQYAKSNLWRSVFDNIKYSVAPRWGAKGDVDLDAANDYTPTALITMGPDGELIPLVTPFVADKAAEMAGSLDMMRAERTGFSRETAGLDPNALADSTNMMGAAILNLSQSRVKMIASTFANTGVKSLCNHIRELLLKNEKRERMMEYNGKFVALQPRGWVKSRTSSVKAGLGYAGKMEIAATMQTVLALQEKLVAAQGGMDGPMVTRDNIYTTIARGLENSGVVDVNSFFTNPEGYQPPPPGPTPQELQIQAYERVEKYKADVKAGVDVKKIEADVVTEQYKVDTDANIKNNELIYKYQKDLKADQNTDLSRIIERGTRQTGQNDLAKSGVSANAG